MHICKYANTKKRPSNLHLCLSHPGFSLSSADVDGIKLTDESEREREGERERERERRLVLGRPDVVNRGEGQGVDGWGG